MHAKWIYIQCINTRFPLGVNTLNEFVYFVRFFLMNKSYIFCALSGITLYNNHTPTPPPRPAEAGA